MLLDKVNQLFEQQTAEWQLAKDNFSVLSNVQIREFSFDGFHVKVQFNPARIHSSGAKLDAKSIAARKCFLCNENLPQEQTYISWKDYQILVNPFPILPQHFTIPKCQHLPQQILPFFTDMLELAYELDDYMIFYNGPRCGASAPDHMHFQAGTKDFLPLINDYKNLKSTNVEMIREEADAQVFLLKNYLRTVYCIESYSIFDAQVLFQNLYSQLQGTSFEEPMMNVLCSYENGKWNVFVIPRGAFRPWQYDAEPAEQLMISPATVEMSGVFITPIKEHFERISKADIVDILKQCGDDNTVNATQ